MILPELFSRKGSKIHNSVHQSRTLVAHEGSVQTAQALPPQSRTQTQERIQINKSSTYATDETNGKENHKLLNIKAQ